MIALLFFDKRIFRYIFILSVFILGSSHLGTAQIQISVVISSDELSDINRTFIKYIQEFNNNNPGTSILLQVKDSYDDASGFFTTNVATGKLSGILLTRCTETIELHESGTILPAETINKKYPNFMNQFSQRYSCCISPLVDSRPYGVPLYRTTPLLYYNINTIRAADQAFSTSNLPQSWQELESLLLKIKKNYPAMTPLVIGGDYYEWIFETFVLQNGGNLFKPDGMPAFDSPEVVQTFAYWKKLASQGLIASASSWKATPNFLINNKCAIIAYSGGANNLLSGVNFSWEAAPIPGYKSRIHGLTGSNFYLSNNMNDVQLSTAIDFLKFLYDKKISTEIANITGMIDVTQDSRASASGSQSYTGVYNSLKIKPNFMVKKHKKIRQILSRAIESMFNSTISPEQALGTAQAEALQEMNR